MAAEYPNLIDLTSRLDPEGRIIPIAEVLAKRDPILKLLRWVECNKTDGYVHGMRTGIPEPTWRKLYEGVQPKKSTVTQVTDTCGNLEMYAEVDKDLADINGNTAQWRLSEQKPFFAGMGNEMASTIFYGDTDINPERFTGIAARYNGLSGFAASRNVIDAGGTTAGKNTSIFIVSLDHLKGIYPKGSKAGPLHTDLKEQTHVESDGSMYQVYRDHYKWQAGITLDDWRSCVRVCNVPVTAAGEIDMTSLDLIALLIKAKNKIPADLRTSVHMFVPAEVNSALELAALNKSSSVVKIVEAAGQFKTNFFDIPIEVSDSIVLTEPVIA